MLPDAPANIHLVGVGGSGLSQLAYLLLSFGYRVSGSDREDTPVVASLRSAGAEVTVGHNASNLQNDCRCVIYSAAIDQNNAELKEARRRGIPLLRYSEALGELMRRRVGIAVAGTHGKSTTSALLAKVLIDSYLQPAFVIGAESEQLRRARQNPSSRLFLVEACEYAGSFLSLQPKYVALTNIEPDHLDYYGSASAMVRSFRRFVSAIPKNGVLLFNSDCALSRRVASSATCRRVSFGRKPSADYRIVRIEKNRNGATFRLNFDGRSMRLSLLIDGLHNIYNAACAFALAHILGIRAYSIRESLESFTGLKRRLEVILKRPVTIIDDYAHHPTEVRAVLATVNSRYPHGRKRFIFQAHQNNRLQRFFGGFLSAFGAAEEVLVAPIYSVRESGIRTRLTPAALAVALESNGVRALHFDDTDSLLEHLKATTSEGDVLCFMGAGDIWRIAYALKASLKELLPMRRRLDVSRRADVV